MLITSDQVDQLLAALADLSGLDEELAQRCALLIRTERYDEAVGRAFVVLEERLRALLGLRGGSGGHLVQKLFSSKDSDLVDRLRLPEAQAEGLHDLFMGAFKAFRNRAAHTVAGYTRDEARGIVQLVSLLLLILDRIRDAPEQTVVPQVAEVLEPAAADRLDRFLSALLQIGYERQERSATDHYRSTFLYRAPPWDEYRPHDVAVLFLWKSAKPTIHLNSGGLSRVRHLDIEQLEASLLEAGCRRVVTKKRSRIELPLLERNDEATLDRVFRILKQVLDTHRVR
jgi:uncharacterized protein (TIGR02391 family)